MHVIRLDVEFNKKAGGREIRRHSAKEIQISSTGSNLKGATPSWLTPLRSVPGQTIRF